MCHLATINRAYEYVIATARSAIYLDTEIDRLPIDDMRFFFLPHMQFIFYHLSHIS